MTPSKSPLLAALIGDALALGPHWIYDPSEIRAKLGRVDSYQDPINSYHPGKQAGDFTHYGDQVMVLAESIAAAGEFDPTDFSERWKHFWESSDNVSYRDGATRMTLSSLNSGASYLTAGSPSHDISAAGRMGALLSIPFVSEETQLSAIRSVVSLTHRAPEVSQAAEFFARTALALRAGSDMHLALTDAWKDFDHPDLDFTSWTASHQSANSDQSDAAALLKFGLDCSTSSAFPGICHLLRRHPRDPVTAMIENVNAGGDSAARGMVLGSVYGAFLPIDALPSKWRTELRASQTIEALLNQLP